MQLKGQSKYASRLDTCEVSTFYFLNKGFAAVRSKVNNAAEGELHEEVGTGGVQAVSVRGRIGQVRWSVEHADSATFYGVAMDGKQGISLDNLAYVVAVGFIYVVFLYIRFAISNVFVHTI